MVRICLRFIPGGERSYCIGYVVADDTTKRITDYLLINQITDPQWIEIEKMTNRGGACNVREVGMHVTTMIEDMSKFEDVMRSWGGIKLATKSELIDAVSQQALDNFLNLHDDVGEGEDVQLRRGLEINLEYVGNLLTQLEVWERMVGNSNLIGVMKYLLEEMSKLLQLAETDDRYQTIKLYSGFGSEAGGVTSPRFGRETGGVHLLRLLQALDGGRVDWITNKTVRDLFGLLWYFALHQKTRGFEGEAEIERLPNDLVAYLTKYATSPSGKSGKSCLDGFDYRAAMQGPDATISSDGSSGAGCGAGGPAATGGYESDDELFPVLPRVPIDIERSDPTAFYSAVAAEGGRSEVAP